MVSRAHLLAWQDALGRIHLSRIQKDTEICLEQSLLGHHKHEEMLPIR